MHHRPRFQFLVSFGYDGSRFYGIQPQKDVPTAGQELRKIIEKTSGYKARGLAFSARTDRGVHARINLATFYLYEEVDIVQWQKDLDKAPNTGLENIKLIPAHFHVHARGISEGKRYIYSIRDQQPSPTTSTKDCWLIHPKLDVEKMQQAAEDLLGTHDFSSLRGGKCGAGSVIKELLSINIRRDDEGVTITVVGDAFLRKMMRNMVGLLVEIGTGWREADTIPGILAQKNRHAAGIMAPANGLCLDQVGSLFPEDGSMRLKEYQGREPARAIPQTKKASKDAL